MKNIRLLLQIIIALVLISAAVFSYLIYASLHNYQAQLHKFEVAEKISSTVFDRRFLADDYLINQSDRAKQQWLDKQSEAEETVNSEQAVFGSDTEKELITSIKRSLNDTKATFNEVLQLNQDKSVSTQSATEKKLLLGGQLSIKSQETISAASNLADLSKQEADQALQETILLFSIVASLFFGLLFFSFWLVWVGIRASERSKAETEAILSSIGDGLVATDQNGRIILINQAGQNILGWSEAELLGQSLAEAVPMTDNQGQSVPTEMRPITAAVSQKRKTSGVFFYQIKNQSRLPVAITVTPIMVNGKLRGAIEVFRDVTEERELETLKDQFLSIASHELRTPMTAIKGLISMIFEGDYGKINKKLEDPLHDVYDSTERLINLVNDMLDVSRIEAGRTKFNLTEFKIKKIAEETVQLLLPIAKTQKLKLTLGDFTDAEVEADVDKVKQILNNLLGNSLKFTDKGGIEIHSKLQGEKVYLYIADSGMGISAEDQKKLFGKFQQVSNDQIGRPKGTGLGLYISKQLAQKMGGDLWIEKSEVGKGTIFGLSLPLAKSEIASKVEEELKKEAEIHPDQK